MMHAQQAAAVAPEGAVRDAKLAGTRARMVERLEVRRGLAAAWGWGRVRRARSDSQRRSGSFRLSDGQEVRASAALTTATRPSAAASANGGAHSAMRSERPICEQVKGTCQRVGRKGVQTESGNER